MTFTGTVRRTTAFLTILAFVLSSVASFGLTAEAVEPLPPVCNAPKDAEQQKNCNDLRALYAEIAQKEVELQQQKGNSASLGRDINILTSQINKSKLEIQAKNRLISQIGGEINLKQKTIAQLNEKMSRQKQSLAQIIRKKNEIDQGSLLEFALSGQSVSEFLSDVDTFQSINTELQNSFDQIREIRGLTAEEQKMLEDRRARENDMKYTLEQSKKQVEVQQGQKQDLLQDSKNKEKTYEQLLADRRAKAAVIKSKLFELRGQSGIPFGDALAYAKEASVKTGVRPAFILAILTQETNLGKNVGTCNRPGDTKTWRDIMPGGAATGSKRDDQAAYLRIVNRLGIPAEGTPLSCPLPNVPGWGGAMGPSQFIPTTWEMYDNRIEKVLGVAVANPWNPQHAITATALYMMDLGAGAKTYTAERNAACKYYSGRGCDDPAVKNAFYGNNVMAIATRIQADITELETLEQ